MEEEGHPKGIYKPLEAFPKVMLLPHGNLAKRPPNVNTRDAGFTASILSKSEKWREVAVPILRYARKERRENILGYFRHSGIFLNHDATIIRD
jgi:hypothetical protein